MTPRETGQRRRRTRQACIAASAILLREEFARRAKGKIGERRALCGPTLAEDRAIGAILFREEAALRSGKIVSIHG
ncbi:hypothetical protein CH337_21465 [Rhodoblastus acidophilus]|nr:hypothetical protein CH337_21465 [Rhodoblastus acidophilus]